VRQQDAVLKTLSLETRTKRFISTHSKFPPVSYLKNPLKKDGFIKSNGVGTGTNNQRQCFNRFMLLSQNFDTPFDSADPNQWSRFKTILDPYIIKKVDCIYTYPSLFDQESLCAEDASPFCCNGIKVRLVPRSGLPKARELGWIGTRSQDYKFLVFTNGDGMETHGFVISTCEEIPLTFSKRNEFMQQILGLRRKRIAARKICSWMEPILRKRKQSTAAFKSGVKIPVSLNFGLQSLTLSSELGARRSRESGGKKGKSVIISEKSKRIAIDSYKSMIESAALGDALIVEKCYVMIGGKQSKQFLHLRLLQNLLETERMASVINESLSKKTKKNRGMHQMFKVVRKSQEGIEEKIFDFRNNYLKVMQQEKISLPTKSLSDTLEEKSLQIHLPSYLSSVPSTIVVPLPLPHVARHWGIAALITRIDTDNLLLLLKLLLVQRSVLIVGASSHLVTSCSCALKEILKSFEWSGNFVSHMPNTMIEFINSPVSFLIGMTVDNAAEVTLIEKNEQVLEALRVGLSVVDLTVTPARVRLTTEPGVLTRLRGLAASLPHFAMCKASIDFIRSRSPEFSKFMCHGFSNKEMVCIDDVFECLQGYFEKFVENLRAYREQEMKNRSAKSNKTVNPPPSPFISKLKEEIDSISDFQDVVVRSIVGNIMIAGENSVFKQRS